MALMFDNVSYFDKVKNFSFVFESGKISGIVGSTGSGKSIIAEMIGGITRPTGGVIYSESKNVGIVYQDIYDQFLFDNIRSEFEFVLKIHNVKDIKKRILSALKMVGLDESYLSRSAFSLSTSEQKRLAISLVLSYNPDIIVFDEVFFSLDNEVKTNLINLIYMLKLRYGKTIIVLSKDSEIIHKISDVVISLNEGAIVSRGSKYDVFTDYDVLKSCHINVPEVIKFSKLVKDKKNINMGFRDDINDLIKDVYRFLEK